MSKAVKNSPKGAQVRVAVAIPCMDSVAADFTYHFGQMMAFSGLTVVADGVVDLSIFMKKATYVAEARDELARAALDWGATHILWLDGDMVFPKDALIRLLNRNEAIVGANYSTRRSPILPVALKTVPGERLYTDEHSTGLEAVEALGFGVCLTRADVFYKMAEKHGVEKPLFLVPHGEDGLPSYQGEDVWFCRKARELGFTPKVDHDLSKEVGHIGSIMYTLDHVNALRIDKPKIILPDAPATPPQLELIKG